MDLRERMPARPEQLAGPSQPTGGSLSSVREALFRSLDRIDRLLSDNNEAFVESNRQDVGQ